MLYETDLYSSLYNYYKPHRLEVLIAVEGRFGSVWFSLSA